MQIHGILIRVGLVEKLEARQWRSVTPYIKGKNDLPVNAAQLCGMLNKNRKQFLTVDVRAAEIEVFKGIDSQQHSDLLISGHRIILQPQNTFFHFPGGCCKRIWI